MPEFDASYEYAITTSRTAETLAKRHGYENLQHLAYSLPQQAKILDVGAGLSPFGKDVCQHRPDITWINLDLSYKRPEILAEAVLDAPDNVFHTARDITLPNDSLLPESFDVVFSYWLLPHLSLDDESPALRAAENIFALTKTGGIIFVGPGNQTAPVPDGSLQIIKEPSVTPDDFARQIVNSTKLSPKDRYIQKIINEAGTTFFGTTRHFKKEGRLLYPYDSQNGNYVHPLSGRGVRLIGGLAIATARYVGRTLTPSLKLGRKKD